MLRVFPLQRFTQNDWKNLLEMPLLNFLPLYIQHAVYTASARIDCITK